MDAWDAPWRSNRYFRGLSDEELAAFPTYGVNGGRRAREMRRRAAVRPVRSPLIDPPFVRFWRALDKIMVDCGEPPVDMGFARRQWALLGQGTRRAYVRSVTGRGA